MFPPEDFATAVEEFENHEENVAANSYEHFLTIRDVFRLYRRPVPDSGLYEYKVKGVFPNLSMDLFARTYLDYEFRSTWDSNVIKTMPLAGHSWDPFTGQEHHLEAFYALKYPMLMANREYAFKLHRKNIKRRSQRYTVVLGSSVNPTSLKMPHVSSGHVVVQPFRQRLVLSPTSDGVGTHFVMSYFEDPGGYIPQMAINCAAKTGLPRWIDQLETACSKYPAYLLSKGRPLVGVISEVALLDDAGDEEGDGDGEEAEGKGEGETQKREEQ